MTGKCCAFWRKIGGFIREKDEDAPLRQGGGGDTGLRTGAASTKAASCPAAGREEEGAEPVADNVTARGV
jgi:hypothetical protein